MSDPATLFDVARELCAKHVARVPFIESVYIIRNETDVMVCGCVREHCDLSEMATYMVAHELAVKFPDLRFHSTLTCHYGATAVYVYVRGLLPTLRAHRRICQIRNAALGRRKG